MFSKLTLSSSTAAEIEWDMTPDLAFCTFSAKGLRDTLTNTDERVCYFFIDNHGDIPKLYLMERGTRFVNILAEVSAPADMLEACIIEHGCSLSTKDNFSVDGTLQAWLLKEVVEQENSPFLIPTIQEEDEEEDFGQSLPAIGETQFNGNKVILETDPCRYSETELKEVITRLNLFDTVLNPEGCFENALAKGDNDLTIIDEQTGLMWQRTGLDLCSIRQMSRDIEQLNKDTFAGFNDWRMPSIEEAMSLVEQVPNKKGIYLHPCFSKEQPFIFVAAKRTPTGYWFVDYKHGKLYWSSGTVPGGFCRLCRSLT